MSDVIGRRSKVARMGQAEQEAAAAMGSARPRTYEELRAVLCSGSTRFPRQLRQVAVFVSQNPSEVAVGNTVEIARKAGVQPSALVRFAQALGFTGFTDLQALFKGYIKVNWPDIGARSGFGIVEVVDGADPDAYLLGGLTQAAMLSLSRLTDSVDPVAFERLADEMTRADTIYLVGSKRAFPVTMYMALALSQLGIKNVLIDNVGSTGFEQLGFAGTGDAVLAISFSPYNSITPALAQKAEQAGAVVLTITDSPFSPLLPVSAAWIEVAEQEFGGFRPLAATLSLGMALVLSVARRRGTWPGRP